MPSQHEKESANIVVLDSSSDEEDGVQVKKRNTSASSPAAPPSQSRPQVTPSGSGYRTLDSQSFWKAGAYEEIRLSRAAPAEGQLEHARVHPKFLHSNATSHKWAFGAMAELLDNAVDEISNGASFVKVDRIYNTRDNSPALLFRDDGGGMNPESLRKCMSLGYSSKKSNTTIGQYGNGFKTSTMRLGADVIVFSRASCSSQATQSVGLLSYTFLRKTGQDDVIVPMVDFDVSNHWAEPIIYGSQDDWSSNLKTILEWSPFASKDHLMQQFEDIGSHGTKIIIYNLWLNDEGVYELNFDDEDEEDIRLRDEGSRGSKPTKRTIEMQSHISYQIRFSLRAYASMLYLRKFKNFQIILRGKPVEQFNIADELKYPKSITYRPQLATTSKEASVETTLGFIKEAPGILICGFNVYHKNRLIRPFWKVTADGNSCGFGVVGVLEANFIEPAHDKQDFERSSLFYKLEMKLKQMQLEYWKSHCELIGHRPLVKNTSMRTMQKEFPVYPPPVELNANVRKHNPTGSHVIGLSANVQNKNLNGPIIGRVANPRQELSGSHLGKSGGTSSRVEMATLRPSTGHATESVQDVVVVDSSRSESIDQICEENIQLFLRCEEHTEKERELKRTVEKLEKEVEETRKKCAQLSAYLEIQRKEKIVKQSAKA